MGKNPARYVRFAGLAAWKSTPRRVKTRDIRIDLDCIAPPGLTGFAMYQRKRNRYRFTIDFFGLTQLVF